MAMSYYSSAKPTRNKLMTIRHRARHISVAVGTLLVLWMFHRTLTRYTGHESQAPKGEWCSLFLIDSGGAADTFDARWLRNYWEALPKEPEDIGAISIQVFDHSEEAFKEIRSADCEIEKPGEKATADDDFAKIDSQLQAAAKEQKAVDESAPLHPFISLAIDQAERLIRRAARESDLPCRRWEVFIAPQGDEWSPGGGTSRIRSHVSRLCPKKTRVVLLKDASKIPDDAGGKLDDLVASLPNLHLIDIDEYRSWKSNRKHLILLDMSGSVGTERDLALWYHQVFPEIILPSFLSWTPLFSDHSYQLTIFGTDQVEIDEGSVHDLLVTPNLTPKNVREVGNTTDLASLMEYIKRKKGKAGGGFRSIWLYTDAEEKTNSETKNISLKEWKEKEGCSKRTASKDGIVYFQLPTRIYQEKGDVSVPALTEALECLGFQVKIVPGYPPTEPEDC
jgi:hypothetical protein